MNETNSMIPLQLALTILIRTHNVLAVFASGNTESRTIKPHKKMVPIVVGQQWSSTQGASAETTLTTQQEDKTAAQDIGQQWDM